MAGRVTRATSSQSQHSTAGEQAAQAEPSTRSSKVSPAPGSLCGSVNKCSFECSRSNRLARWDFHITSVGDRRNNNSRIRFHVTLYISVCSSFVHAHSLILLIDLHRGIGLCAFRITSVKTLCQFRLVNHVGSKLIT